MRTKEEIDVLTQAGNFAKDSVYFSFKELIQTRIEEVKEEIQRLEDGENEEEYNEMLDECFPSFKIGNSEFMPSDILKNCDEIMYNTGLCEYNDEKINELEQELEELEEDLKDLEDENEEVTE